MAFQQMQVPGNMPLPQQPTGNGFQVAGEALQQGGDAIGKYGAIFQSMVEDRKNALIQAQQREVEDKKNQIFFEGVEHKKRQEAEAEKKKKSYFDSVAKIPHDAPDRKSQLDRAWQAYSGGSPEDYHKTQIAPYEKDSDNKAAQEEWDRRQGITHGNKMEELGAKKTAIAKAKRPSFTGYTGIAKSKLEEIWDKPGKKEAVQEETSVKIKRLTNDVTVFQQYLDTIKDDPDLESSLRTKNVKVKLNNSMKELQQWQSLESALQNPATFENQQSQEQPSTNNGTSTPPQIQKALKWLQDNPNDPNAEAVRRRLQSEGYL